jgi:dGTPase
MPSSLEGMCVRIADRVAYINHDIDDAVRAGVLKIEDLPQDTLDILGRTHSARIASMVMNVLTSSVGKPHVAMTGEILEATNRLKDYMYAHVYTHTTRGEEDMRQAYEMLGSLFRLYMGQPNLFSGEADLDLRHGFEHLPVPERARQVADYIAGMTDRYAVSRYRRHFGE